jgi:hypothetical protein
LTDETHDSLQQINQLRQALAAPKLSVGFFIGAGCPCSIKTGVHKDQPLIPDVAGLSQQVIATVAASEKYKASFERVLAVFTQDGKTNPNIEDILGKIRALADVAGKDKARGLTAEELIGLDKIICETITGIVDCECESEDNPYRSLARFVESRSRPAAEIFTTNYDLLVELALEAQRVPFFDGFVGGVRPFFDQRAIDDDIIPARWCRVWKLHGSINWRLNPLLKTIFRSKEKSDGVEQLIHPSHRKYDESRRMPYFVMIDRLRNFIRNQKQPVALFVTGYSFSDQHINEALIEGLKANPSAICYALQFDELAKYPIATKLATDVANFSVLARDSAVIRRRRGKWLSRSSVDQSSILSGFTMKDEPSESDKPIPSEFVLGDFSRLALFLDEFILLDPARVDA